MWKRVVIGLLVAFVAMFLLKDLPFGMLVFLIGLIIAGLPGTIIFLYILLFTSLLQFSLPIFILFIWLALDISEFIARMLPIFSGLILWKIILTIVPIIVKLIVLIIFAYPIITDILSGVTGI